MIQKLYHYTTYNNLAVILSSKTIRFGRLDKVNDPTEGQSSDFHSLAIYIFVSCWTHNMEENLALWNMYTPQMRGVRIELSLPLFETYNIDGVENCLCQKDEYVNEKDKIFIFGGRNTPYPIEYTTEKEKLTPRIKTAIGLNVAQLGKYKNKIWSFEEEYRYRLDIVPINNNSSENFFPDRYMDFMEKAVPPSIDSYFIKIREGSFSSMKILISPKSLPGDKEIVLSLIEKYNNTATILESNLKGSIR